MFPPPNQNTLGLCNQITRLVLYYISSRLVTLPEIINVPIEVSDIFYLNISFYFINFFIADIPSFCS